MVEVKVGEANIATRITLSPEKKRTIKDKLDLFERAFVSEYSSNQKKLLIDYLAAMIINIREGVLPDEALSQFEQEKQREVRYGFLADQTEELGMTGWRYLHLLAKGV